MLLLIHPTYYYLKEACVLLFTADFQTIYCCNLHITLGSGQVLGVRKAKKNYRLVNENAIKCNAAQCSTNKPLVSKLEPPTFVSCFICSRDYWCDCPDQIKMIKMFWSIRSNNLFFWCFFFLCWINPYINLICLTLAFAQNWSHSQLGVPVHAAARQNKPFSATVN